MSNKLIEEKINGIEAEMKRIGLWQAEPIPEDLITNIQEAFGADKLSLAQWLQFVFIPRVHELLKTNGPWPELSEVGIYAAQQYLFFRPTENSNEYASQGSIDRKESVLVRLLQDFDSLFTPVKKPVN